MTTENFKRFTGSETDTDCPIEDQYVTDNHTSKTYYVDSSFDELIHLLNKMNEEIVFWKC